MSPSQANILFQAGREWKWIEDYTEGSEFWKYYDYEFKKSPPTEEDFVEYLKGNLFNPDLIIDEDLRKKLEKLRIYLLKDL